MKNKKMNFMENYVLINNDCREVLYKYPDNYFDGVITSPPYNMNLRVSNGRYHSRQITKELSTKYEGFDDNMGLVDLFEFNKDLIEDCMRVSRLVFYNVQLLTGNRPAFLKLLGHFCHQVKDIIVWDKLNSQPAIGQNIMNSRFELIIIFSKDRGWTRTIEGSAFGRGTLDNLWQIKKQRSVIKSHGAVFPEELVEKIIKEFSLSSVLDPMMGTGTTGVVARKLNVPFVGIEKMKSYYNVANNRIIGAK